MNGRQQVIFAVPERQAASEGWIRSTCIPLGRFGNMVILTQYSERERDASTMQYFELERGVRRFDQTGLDIMESL